MKKASKPTSRADSKTKGLQQEAADMETKLMELRRAMEAERAKREAIMSAGNAGGFWQSGASGLLRSNFRTKQTAGPAAPSPASGVSAGPRAAAGTSGPPSRTGSASASRAEVAGKAAGSTSGTESSSAQRPSRAPGSLPPTAPKTPPDVAVVGSATARRAPANVLSVHHDKAPAEGFACGTDDNDDLAAGAFNEADSHKSFLEALNEWRSANKADKTQPSATAATRSSAPHQPGASMEVQTEAASKAARPQSASKKSYFDKFALNSASRQAGASASGAVPTDAPATSTSAPRPASQAVQLPSSSTTSAAAAGRSVPALKAELSTLEEKMALLDRLEQLEQQRQQQQDEAAEDAGDEEIVVTTHTTVGLVKGVHLPDAILLPDHAAEE